MAKRISRRDFLKNAATVVGAVTTGGLLANCAPPPAPANPPAATAPAAVAPTTAPAAAPTAAAAPAAARKVWLGNSIRSLSNPYHAAWNAGGEMFAKDMGLSDSYQVLLCEGDNTKQLDDIKALIAKAGKDVVFNVDPNEASNAVPIAKICEEAGVYFTTHWNKPADAHPWDYKYWVAHMAADDVGMGYECGKAIAEALKGKGNVCHIQGMLGNTAAQGRQAGFEKAMKEYPDMKILDMQTGDWDQTKAQNVVETWLAKFPDINGIHCAGDMHALGAAAAIKAASPDQLGKILITGCAGDEPTTKAIIAGEVFATSGISAPWQGGMGLNLAYLSLLGKYDSAKEPKEHREFFFKTTLVNKANAQDWYDNNIKSAPKIDWNDLWSNWLRGMA